MKEKKVEIVAIIDRSGSMNNIESDAIGGFNKFLQDQKELLLDISFSLILFNHSYDIVYDGVDIKKVPELTSEKYRVGGSTALYDAIGTSINTVGNRLSSLPEEERPEKVVFAILTDGEENSSREFSQDDVYKKITHQKEKYSWEFIFLAANQDAFATGVKFGINKKDTYNFNADSQGIQTAYVDMSRSVTGYISKP